MSVSALEAFCVSLAMAMAVCVYGYENYVGTCMSIWVPIYYIILS